MRLSLRRSLALVVISLFALTGGSVATKRVAYMVTDGVSMNPTYHAGDFVVVVRHGSYEVGDVVAYRSDDLTVLHRIIDGGPSGFVTRGDNNESIDPDRPSSDQVIGRAVLHVPNLGKVITSPVSRALLVVAVLALIGALIVKPSRDRTAASAAGHHSRKEAATSTSAVPLARPARARTVWKSLLALDALLLAVLGLTFRFAPEPVTPPPAKHQTATLGYHADVPPSDVYPTGTVVTGDPVFRRLVDVLVVSFRYTTDGPSSSVTGTAQLDATVSTADGWATTLPLVPASPLVGGTAELSGTLDLDQLQALVDRVADQTGINPAGTQVVVAASGEASLDGADPVPYRAELSLQLTPLTVSLSGGSLIDSPEGPVIAATVPFNAAPPGPARESGGVPPRARYAFIAVLLLSIAGTAMVWPTPDGDGTDLEPVPRVRTTGAQMSRSAARFELADPAQLEDLARSVGRPILQGDDGWEGVSTPGAWYWIRTSPPVADAQPHAPTAQEEDPRDNGVTRWPVRLG